MAKLLRIAPEVPVADVRKSAAYYTEKLGFETVMVMAAGDYAVVERDGAAIHLFEAGSGVSPVSLHIFTRGLDDLQAELGRRGTTITQEIEKKPWGNRDFRVKDEFGNELKFTEPSDGRG
jgi:uncharacterized glyoxalase superfamily protein PhnB